MLSVRNLSVEFPVWGDNGKATLKAVNDVSFDLGEGEVLGIVGESGCGKSTLARAVLRLLPVSSGTVIWDGTDVTALRGSRNLRDFRRDVQVILQDPLGSLDPRMTIGQIIAEPLEILRPGLSRAERDVKVLDILARVGLRQQVLNRYPHEFSGGQCQRVGIARAMIVKPKMIVCDESVSALDVSVQAQIINLLNKLRKEFNLSLLFISHDLSVIRHISQRVMVLYLGKVMEIAPSAALFERPMHPYTKALISAVPVFDIGAETDVSDKVSRKRERLSSDMPSPINPPSGCVFRTRCPYTSERCAQQIPTLQSPVAGRTLACHHWQEIA